MSFRPGLWPSLITLPALALLIALGLWQLERHQWKQAILADLAAARLAEPEPLPATLDDTRAWRFRPVIVEGHYLTDRYFRVFSTRRQGWTIYQPLVRADGAPVLVHRGPVGPAPAGLVRVTGLVRLPRSPGWFAPDNDAPANEWYRADPDAMAAAAGLTRLAPVVVDAVAWREGRFPAPHDRHLAYALTWFGFAVTLGAVYGIYGIRRGVYGTRP